MDSRKVFGLIQKLRAQARSFYCLVHFCCLLEFADVAFSLTYLFGIGSKPAPLAPPAALDCHGFECVDTVFKRRQFTLCVTEYELHKRLVVAHLFHPAGYSLQLGALCRFVARVPAEYLVVAVEWPHNWRVHFAELARLF